MKRTLLKSLAVVLVIIMTFSYAGLCAGAVTCENVIQYGKEGGYLAIGDSICRGCGAEGFYIDRNGETVPGGKGDDQYDDYQVRNVQGCLPYQIAQAVGCEAPFLMDEDTENATYWPFAFPGMTTSAALDLYGIDDGFDDDILQYDYYDAMLEYFGYVGTDEKYTGSYDGFVPNKYVNRLEEAKTNGDTAKVEELTEKIDGYKLNPDNCGKCANIIDVTKRADLITIELGMCDVFYRPYRIVNNGGMLKDGFSLDINGLDSVKNIVSTTVTEMKNGYEYWKESYTLLLDAIKDLNPDATVVIVGAFNVLNQLTIADETMMPLGSAFSALTEAMNKQYKKWAEEYGYIYVDVSNTEPQIAENDWSLIGDYLSNTLTGSHPTQTGYNYMARQILDALSEGNKDKNIKVDLGRFEKVDSVYVNGIKISDYEMDGFVLSIPYSGPLAATLAIKVKNDDGGTAIQTYSLSYNSGNGYTAHRIYGNNNIEELLSRPLKLIKALFDLVIKTIKKLFK